MEKCLKENHLSTQFIISLVLTSSLSFLRSSLVDIKDSGDIDLHGMKVIPNQCPQLKLSWVSRLHQLTTKITVVISDNYNDNIILLTIFSYILKFSFSGYRAQIFGDFQTNIQFHRFLNSWTMNPTTKVSED